MSQCKSKGLHYVVKDRRHGYACLICGLAGLLEDVRSSPCLTPSPTKPDPVHDAKKHDEDLAAIRDAQRAFQEAQDRALALELADLQKQAAEMEQLVLLEALEAEEAELQGLLNQERALKLELKVRERAATTAGAGPSGSSADPGTPQLTKRSEIDTGVSSHGESPSAVSINMPYGILA